MTERPLALVAAIALAVSACGGAPILISAPMLGSETSSSSSSSGPAAAGGIDGDWEGRGVQSNERSWPMRVHLAAMEHSVAAQVFYPDEGCTGEWAMHEVEQGLWEGDETIRSDPRHKCIASGSVTLRRIEDGTLEWTWEGIDPSTGADLSAHAVLTRGQAQPQTPRSR